MRAGCPVGSNGGHEVRHVGSGARLLLATVLCVALSAPAHAATPLRTIVEDVPGSTAYSYGARDNLGNSMHTLKVVKSPFGGYLGVYHTVIDSRYVVKVATSVDLLNWRFAANLAVDALAADHLRAQARARRWSPTRPTPAARPASGAWCCATMGPSRRCSAAPRARTLILPRTLSNCAEGTPNIFSATSNLATVDIGFHYFQDCRVDRQARGTLRDFDPATWAPVATPGIDAGILGAGASADGMIGDRDGGSYDGYLPPPDRGAARRRATSAPGATSCGPAGARRSSRSAPTAARRRSRTRRSHRCRCRTVSPAWS